MKLISWNVNGLRACLKKDFLPSFLALNADIFCLQETKLSLEPPEMELPPDYDVFWNYAEKKGYSGTAVFTRHAPLAVSYGIGQAEHDREGRVITLEFESFFLVNVYTPNAQDGLRRLAYRLEWEAAFAHYIMGLDAQKSVIVCGDLNVAHREIDLKNPKTNRNSPGFSDEERAALGQLLDGGMTDTFRALHPDTEGAYSWWSYRAGARERNAGWRIDYFLVSTRWAKHIKAATIHSDIFGSDHCPVGLEIDV